MPIKVTCDACGKTLKAKDDYAGRTTKCPGCGEPLTIPEPVYDAEQVDDDDYGDVDGGYADDDYDNDDYGTEASDGADDRKPCRACGEMIKRSAAKCRFCGEIFDVTIAKPGRGSADPETIKKFRREMHGLGGFWIFIGTIVLFLGIGIMATGGGGNPALAGQGPILGAVFLILGLLWFGLGVCTCLKHMWAVWTGLVLSYLSVLGNLMNLPQSVCGLIFLAVAIVQAHKCIKRAKELNAAGVPLTTKA